nr:4Fe-4S dicluster domain-containing protein [uncultured Bacteroides sp.]
MKCIQSCPIHVFEIKESENSKTILPIGERNCIQCQKCAVNCPSDSIYIHETFMNGLRIALREHQTRRICHSRAVGGQMIDVEAIVPGGVLCLFSAWNVHGLTTSLPQAYHVAVKRGRKITLPTFPKIELHHITDTMFDIGVEELVVSGYHVHIYNKERCVCDAVKYRNKIGMDVCSEVVNRWRTHRRGVP